MPKKPEREYRASALLSTTINTEKKFDTDYYVEGYATTFDKPYLLYEYEGIKYYEKIDRHALDEADLSDVIMQYDHSGKVLARNSNNTLYFDINDDGFFIAADLSKSDQARNLHEEIKNGLIKKMSWAFIVSEDSYNHKTHTRTILKVKKVYDVSAVSIPANDDTNIVARNFINGEIEKERRESEARQKRIKKLKLKVRLSE